MKRIGLLSLLSLLSLLFLAACATEHPHTIHAKTQGTFKVGDPYKVEGTWYYPKEQYDLVEKGIASWYGPGFDGGHTASGEIYHADELTAAHRTLQMPSLVRVTNLDNGHSVIVRVNDRGPYARGRIMDVSSKAAGLLGMKGAGTAKVQLQVLSAESMRVAQLARTGASTRGFETAYNTPNGAPAPTTTEQIAQTPLAAPPAPVEALPSGVAPNYDLAASQSVPASTLPAAGPVPGHMRGNTFYPDAVVTQLPVHPTGIYVQAGSFTSRDNADRLALILVRFNAGVAQTMVNGRQFFRVRIGPISSVPAADAVLGRVVRAGSHSAIITVE